MEHKYSIFTIYIKPRTQMRYTCGSRVGGSIPG